LKYGTNPCGISQSLIQSVQKRFKNLEALIELGKKIFIQHNSIS